MSRWVTNLEAVEFLESELERAISAAKSAPGREAQYAVEIARYKLADVKRTLHLIMQEHPGATIGAPMATEQRTSAEIAADGIIGIYKPGAGSEVKLRDVRTLTLGELQAMPLGST